ncbi:MAG: hypothetical protein ACREAC_30130, partial [Blastocatellia bacterium]
MYEPHATLVRLYLETGDLKSARQEYEALKVLNHYDAEWILSGIEQAEELEKAKLRVKSHPDDA